MTSTADSGTGSLRAAITAANLNAGADVITFDPVVFPPPPALPGVIVLTSALPNLTGAGDTIDGTSAGVVLDGTNLPDDAGLRVRASNVTIRGLTIQNFIGNDGVRVEGRNATPVVTGVLIINNTFVNNNRGVQIDGGNQADNTTVSASVIGNLLQQNRNGIRVRGNNTGSDGGNSVSGVIDGNTVQAKAIEPFAGGNGIQVRGGTDIGSNNNVTATVSNNTLVNIPDDGIGAHGCGADDTGSNNTVSVTITGNTVKYKNDNSPANFRNQGITVGGAGGESDLISFCSNNTIVFEISGNNVAGFKTNNINVGGGDEGTQSNIVQGSILANHVSGAIEGRGINVSGGRGNGHSVAVLISNNMSSSNGADGIRITAGSGINNIVSVAGIITNTTSRNAGDGIAISSNVPGINGGTPVSGNRADRNGEDGIDIDSTGYVLSNNRASRNAESGIDAVGNVNGGGNIASCNASCNTPGCF